MIPPAIRRGRGGSGEHSPGQKMAPPLSRSVPFNRVLPLRVCEVTRKCLCPRAGASGRAGRRFGRSFISGGPTTWQRLRRH